MNTPTTGRDRRPHLLSSTLALWAALALPGCASMGEEGGSGAAKQQASAGEAASGPAGAAKAGEAAPTGQSVQAPQTAEAAKKARPQSLGIDTDRWLSARDKKLGLPAAKLTTIYDNVVYQPEAVVFDVTSVQAYTKHNAETGAYVFDAGKLAAAGIEFQAGKAFMIPGLALRRVTKVESKGEVVTVQTEQAALNEVIKDGTVGFKAKLSLDPQHVIGWIDSGALLPAIPQHDEGLQEELAPSSLLAMPGGHGAASSAFTTRYPELFSAAAPAANPDGLGAGHMKWSYSKGNISYNLELDARGEDAKVLIKATKGSGANAEFQYWAKGTFKNVYLNAKGEYKDGEVKSLEYDQPDMVGDFEIAMAATGKGKGAGEINFTLPEAVLRWVFPVGSVPMVVEVSAKMIGRVQVPVKASATATAKFKWSGRAGLKYKGSDVKTEGLFKAVDMKPEPFDSAGMIGSAVDAQWGVGIPRVSASAFGTFFVPYIQPGITIGSRLTWGPVCKSGYVRFNVIAGWDFGVLGVKLASDKQTLYQKEQRAPKGGCK